MSDINIFKNFWGKPIFLDEISVKQIFFFRSIVLINVDISFSNISWYLRFAFTEKLNLIIKIKNVI